MDGRHEAERESVPHPDDVGVDDAVIAIAGQFSVIQGRPDRVAECCRRIEAALPPEPSAGDLDRLSPLLPLLSEHSGPVVTPLFEFLERLASVCADPWPLIRGMVAAREDSLVLRALGVAVRRAADGSFAVTRDVVAGLAAAAELPGKRLAEPACLPALAQLFRCHAPGGPDTVEALYVGDPDPAVRSLAARILDMSGEPIAAGLALRALGVEAYEFLSPYLVFSRASHLDVACLLPEPGVAPPLLEPLRRAEGVLGRDLLRKVIAETGWPRLNAGIEARRYVRVAAGDSVPLVLPPADAALVARCGGTRSAADEFLVVVEGGALAAGPADDGSEDPASRFRAYNLAHAEVLSDFLAIAPLTAERVRSILRRMDSIVDDYLGLFSALSDECAILADVYGRLRERIIAELAAGGGGGRISPELTRLTVMFEDPRTLGQVRTLHGLKRYLHQKGLQLGFRLVGRSRSTNRTVGLLHLSGDRIVRSVDAIRYTDFEPGAGGPAPMPYAVSLAAEGFGRQLLQGQEGFPRVDAFCYGTEVHYYLAFGNHPAFLRINYAPPLQGGMVDLEYYGVSKYDLESHPDFSLSALRRFFKALGFHVDVENTRVHARFDKEHTPDLRTLCEKAAEVFCLAPFLLDIDWTIGGLTLGEEARVTVASEWAESFAVWGVLPLRSLLTADRQGVIERMASTPSGREEVAWTGATPYRDLFTAGDPGLYRELYAIGAELSPDVSPILPGREGDRTGQLRLERTLFVPLREAASRGELVESADGYERSSPALFRRIPAPEWFAGLVSCGGERAVAAATLASIVAPIERFLAFRTTGSVGGHEVQSARLPLQGEDLGVHLLRAEGNLAFYTHGNVLFERRPSEDAPWTANVRLDPPALLALLRRANYPVAGTGAAVPDPAGVVAAIREDLAAATPPEPRVPVPGERTLEGLRASPGRAVGRALFGTEGRTPADFDGAVLVTPSLGTSDGPFLNRAAGVVSTGGGILSHAALLAAQFRKPAIIVDGRWRPEPGGGRSLRYASTEYELVGTTAHGIRTWSRNRPREVGHVLREGDLVALDANEDVLRILGQGPDVLTLHEGFRQFGLASRDLAGASGDREVLLHRGRRIRARHQIGKVLSKMADCALACHAVHEILLDAEGMGRFATGTEKAGLIATLLRNEAVAGVARRHLRWTVRELRHRFETSVRNAMKRIPDSRSPYEILALRLDALRAAGSLNDVVPSLAECGFDAVPAGESSVSGIEALTRSRLATLRREEAASLGDLAGTGGSGAVALLRHRLRAWERIDRLVPAEPAERAAAGCARGLLASSDEAALKALAGRIVVGPGDGGIELHPLIGWKGANLAEIARLRGGELVPPWFAVTDRAFRLVLDAPIERLLPGGATGVMKPAGGASTIREAIGGMLSNSGADPVQASALIRHLWSSIALPQELADEVVAAYHGLAPGEPLVALRSSSHEEDTEVAARAGEFDTFLYVRGERQLLDHLLRTWGGLWSERALHTRAMLGAQASFSGGGVIVQRMVDSRVSGVVQTVNVARNEFREIVINAGLGLGEGIVSGTVAADQVTVAKDPAGGPLRFTYATADKQEYVVFNRRAGTGTMRCEPPYHQRMRPALEYQELADLVETASALEAAYGHPLDIEFAIEGDRLWVLQARPVPASHAFLQETLGHHPLSAHAAAATTTNGEQRP